MAGEESEVGDSSFKMAVRRALASVKKRSEQHAAGLIRRLPTLHTQQMMLSHEGRHQHGLYVLATLGTREGGTVSWGSLADACRAQLRQLSWSTLGHPRPPSTLTFDVRVSLLLHKKISTSGAFLLPRSVPPCSPTARIRPARLLRSRRRASGSETCVVGKACAAVLPRSEVLADGQDETLFPIG